MTFPICIRDLRKFNGGETATTRGIRFRTQTCLRKKANGARPPLGTWFNIIVTDQKTGIKTAYRHPIEGEKRCLNFVHQFWYKQFKPERLFFFKLEFQEEASGQTVGNLGVGINPWDEKWTFGRDQIHLSKEYIEEVAESEKIYSRFYLNRYTYFTLRFRYEIDKFLNLVVRKSVLLHLEPRMLRYNSRREGRFGSYNLRDGIYLMKVALEKQYLDPSTKGTIVKTSSEVSRGGKGRSHQLLVGKDDMRKKHHISIVKRLVRVIDGKIIAPIEFDVKDLRIMRIRAQMMIQLEPVEEWRHYMVKLYNSFYERQIKRVRQDTQVLTWRAFEDLKLEKIRNMKKIIKAMSKNERAVHLLIEEKYRQERESGKTYEVDGKFYKGCYGVSEIRWGDIFKLFNLKHPQLESFSLGSLAALDQSIKDDSRLHRTDDGKFCYIPYNVVRPMVLNDFMNVPLNPIPGLDLNEFVDPLDASGVDKETFFGPVTLLLNGNSSTMRPTRNISEFVCQHIDCDQFKTEKDYRKLFENWEDDEDVSLDRTYDYSQYFNSMRYLNNFQVDDLIRRMREENRQYGILEGARAQIYNYLQAYNLDFLSKSNEEIYEVNVPQCQGQIEEIKDIRPCLKRTDHHHLDWNDSSERWDRLDKDFDRLIHALRLSEKLSEKLCRYFVSRILPYERTRRSLNYSKSGAQFRNESLLKGFVNECMDTFELSEKQMKKCGSSSLTEEEQIDCKSRERTRNRKGFLNIERKLRVRKTGRYFYKGGKSMNIDVGASFSLNHDNRYADSRSGGLGAGGLKSLIKPKGLLRGARVFSYEMGRSVPLVSAVLKSIFADYSISSSESNSFSDGTSINEKTFLVMQDAMMDIELLDYVKCATIQLDFESLKTNGFGARLASMIDSQIQGLLSEGTIRGEEFDRYRERYFLQLTRGLLVCDKPESEKYEHPEPLAIREHYYYFTQHFTEGDVLDPGDLYNHPWLLAIRGKTDVWRFLHRIRAQEVVLSDGIFPKGTVVKRHEFPIKKLVQAYSGVTPSFPGIYTMLHNEFEYEADFPWDDQPADSFRARFLKSMAGEGTITSDVPMHFMDRHTVELGSLDYGGRVSDVAGQTPEELFLENFLDPLHGELKTCTGEYTVIVGHCKSEK